MVYCSVSNCSNCSGKGYCSSKGISYHCFPINPEVKEKWILATGKKNWFPSKHSKICSAHFQEKDFNPTRKRRVLLDHAYPTIHVWTTSENVSDIQVNVTPSKSPSPSMSSKSAKRAIQLDPDIMETPRKRKMQRIINEKENVIKTQRSKIKSLQGKNRRYRKKIIELQEIIKELQSNRLINSDQAFFLENTNVNTKELFKRCEKKLKSKKLTREKYSPSLRSFVWK